MIAKLKGIVDSIIDGTAIIDVQGVGYLAHCSQKTLDRLPQPGEATELLIETVVREDAFTLFGFATAEEKQLFTLLTSVQGVGKKMGLSLLSALEPNTLLQAIAQGDKTSLTRADGVGPKLAGRLINELKDKVGSLSFMPAASTSSSVSFDAAPTSNNSEDALQALLSLGYKRPEILAILNQLDPELTAQEMIRESLSLLSRRTS